MRAAADGTENRPSGCKFCSPTSAYLAAAEHILFGFSFPSHDLNHVSQQKLVPACFIQMGVKLAEACTTTVSTHPSVARFYTPPGSGEVLLVATGGGRDAARGFTFIVRSF